MRQRASSNRCRTARRVSSSRSIGRIHAAVSDGELGEAGGGRRWQPVPASARRRLPGDGSCRHRAMRRSRRCSTSAFTRCRRAAGAFSRRSRSAGGRWPPDIVHEAAGLAGDERPLVGRLRASHFLRASGSAHRVEPYHDRIRETVAASVSSEDRRRASCRDRPRARGARRVDDPEGLYEHYREAGNHEEAATHASLAAQRRTRRSRSIARRRTTGPRWICDSCGPEQQRLERAAGCRARPMPIAPAEAGGGLPRSRSATPSRRVASSSNAPPRNSSSSVVTSTAAST